jgi:hypothetical protein
MRAGWLSTRRLRSTAQRVCSADLDTSGTILSTLTVAPERPTVASVHACLCYANACTPLEVSAKASLAVRRVQAWRSLAGEIVAPDMMADGTTHGLDDGDVGALRSDAPRRRLCEPRV